MSHRSSQNKFIMLQEQGEKLGHQLALILIWLAFSIGQSSHRLPKQTLQVPRGTLVSDYVILYLIPCVTPQDKRTSEWECWVNLGSVLYYACPIWKVTD